MLGSIKPTKKALKPKIDSHRQNPTNRWAKHLQNPITYFRKHLLGPRRAETAAQHLEEILPGMPWPCFRGRQFGTGQSGRGQRLFEGGFGQ